MSNRVSSENAQLLIAASLDPCGDEVIGWTVHFHPERAIWCGELSQLAFKRLPPAVRAALPNGSGWHVVEYHFYAAGDAVAIVLAKVADEAAGLALAQTIARGRVAEITEESRAHGRPADQAR